MRFLLILATILWTSVGTAVSSETLSTISGPFQVSPSISALTSDDCLSTVDWHKIILITAVPIAAGFGLLLLLAFLKDLRQACKSNRSRPPAPQPIRGNRARKERTYVIDVDYGGRSKWGLFLRWCIVHKSSNEIKNRRLVRLRGSTGFSNWVSFDLVLGKKSEKKTVTTPRSIGSLVAVEMKYPPSSNRFHARSLPTSTNGACLRGILNRACEIEIRLIHAMDTKTQDHYFTVSGPSSGDISSSVQGITTTLPLLFSDSLHKTKINYIAYYLMNASLWTSTFMPQYQGNFTGVRHITCLFACISYTMVAADLLSDLAVKSSMEESILVSWPIYNLSLAVVIRAAAVGAVVFLFLGIVEMIFRAAPSIWSLYTPCVPVQRLNGDIFTNGAQPTSVQSVAGDFCRGNPESVEEGLPRVSRSAPDVMQSQSSKQVRNKTWMYTNGPVLYGKENLCTILSNAPTTMINALEVKAKNVKSPPTKMHAAGLTRYSQWTVVNGHRIYKYHTEKLNSTKLNRSTTAHVKSDVSLSLDTTINHTCDDINDIKLKNSTKPAVNSDGNAAGSGNRSFPSSPTNVKSSSPVTNTVTSYQPRSTSSASVTRSSTPLFCSKLIDEARPNDNHDAKNIQATEDYLTLTETKQTETTPLDEPLRSRPDSTPCSPPATSQLYYKHKITLQKQAAGDGHHGAHTGQYKFEDRNASEEFISCTASLEEENIKTAKVMRTRNYINKFTDMGKAKIVILPYEDFETPQDVSETEEVNLISVLHNSSPAKKNPAKKTPADPGSVAFHSNYTINIPMEFELPSVTIQTSSSLKSVFFGIKRWFAGLRSKPRPDIGDDYKLEVTEYDSSIKNADENTSMQSVPREAVENQTTQTGVNGAKTYQDIISSYLPVSGNNNCATEENLAKVDDHLQGSVFQSVSCLIEYHPQAVSSSSSWSSIQLAQNSLQKQLTPHDDLTASNKNNNSKDTTIVQVDPTPSQPKTDSESSKEYFSFESSKTSEESSLQPKSSTSEGIRGSRSITSDDSTCGTKCMRSDKNQDKSKRLPVKGSVFTEDASSNSYPRSEVYSNSIFSSSNSVADFEHPRYHYYQALYEAEMTSTSSTESNNIVQVLMIILFISHIILIASCVLALLWSISSIHGFCWNAFWEWAATAITAVVIQAVIYDSIKAAILTFLKRLSFKEATKPKPYSVIL